MLEKKEWKKTTFESTVFMEQNKEDKYTPEEYTMGKSTIYIFIIILQTI